MGAPKARCSPEPRMCEPLILRTRIPHASPPVTEPAQGTPRAIRGQPSTEFGRTPNHVANPPRNKVAKMREGVTEENSRTDHATNPPKNEAVNMREAA